MTGRREKGEESLDDKTILCFGALLHDIGKVVYRGFSGKGTHSLLGAKFIDEEVAPLNPRGGKSLIRFASIMHVK